MCTDSSVRFRGSQFPLRADAAAPAILHCISLRGAGGSFLPPSLQVLARIPQRQIPAGSPALAGRGGGCGSVEGAGRAGGAARPAGERCVEPERHQPGMRCPFPQPPLSAASVPPAAAQALHCYTLRVIMSRIKKKEFSHNYFYLFTTIFPIFLVSVPLILPFP